MTRTLGLTDCIRFHGFRQKDELPAFFAQSTCFLFQTDFDIWGLVLNEAMSAGLPCISSTNAGATSDLVIDGENGFVADFSKHEEVIEKIEMLLNNPDKARKMGEEAARFIRSRQALLLAQAVLLRHCNR
jgi:glycosyltransferase involved in cell wall biosynthesis